MSQPVYRSEVVLFPSLGDLVSTRQKMYLQRNMKRVRLTIVVVEKQ